MKTNYHRLFIGLSIAIVYCVSANEFIFTSQFNEIMKRVEGKYNQQFYQIENKYRIAMKEENPAGEMAQTHFHEHYVAQMFRKCPDGYYSIFQYTDSHYTPPKINKWYEHLYKQGTTTYHPVYMIKGYSELDSDFKVYEQSEDKIYVEIELFGKALLNTKWYKLGKYHAILNYAFEVKKVVSAGGTNAFPVFGNGKKPSGFSCEYLQVNNGTYVD